MIGRLVLATLLLTASEGAALATAEICGDGIDNNGNGLTDEGCYPSITTGVCESPYRAMKQAWLVGAQGRFTMTCRRMYHQRCPSGRELPFDDFIHHSMLRRQIQRASTTFRSDLGGNIRT